MKQPIRFLQKFSACILLIALAAGCTVLIKDTLDARSPENSLPIINVQCGYDLQNVQRAGFTWNFITAKNKVWPSEEPPGLPLVISTVQPSSPIVISFSDESGLESVKVSRSEGVGAAEYVVQTGDLRSPTTEGVYTYRIDAKFKKGEITYFFRVDVLAQ
ncbi:MAG: hypothetical protein PHG02_08110 [Oscillospiraceae bacterium]|nr:hypothetical protein [Oscillospiraceae bacterium]